MEETIGIILNNWTGLKMSIEHGMGGSPPLVAEKVSCMIKLIIEKLSVANVTWENISDCLEEIMDVEFNTILEDGSTDEIAQVICELWYLWRQDDHSGLSAKVNVMPIKIPLQNDFKLPPVPQPRVASCQTDTAGNSYIVEETSNEKWTEVRRRR